MGTSPESGEGKDVSDPRQDWLGRAATARFVAVVAALVMAAGASVVVLTLVRERPIPGVNTLLIPVILLAVACGAWAGLAVRAGNPLPAHHPDRNATNLIKRFTHPAEWWGLARHARLALAVVGVVSFFVAASSNPSLGEGNNDPSISVCSPESSRALTCVSYLLHQHALAARQRFFAALIVGFFTFVFGVALSSLRSGVGTAPLLTGDDPAEQQYIVRAGRRRSTGSSA